MAKGKEQEPSPEEIIAQLSKMVFLRRDHGAISIVSVLEVVLYFYKDCLFGLHNMISNEGHVWKPHGGERKPWESINLADIKPEYIDLIKQDMTQRYPGDKQFVFFEHDSISIQEKALQLVLAVLSEEIQRRIGAE